MPALISEPLTRPDNFQVIRDQIAAILAIELANQRILTGIEQPAVYRERSNPIGVFLEAPEENAQGRGEPPPIVNVWFDNYAVDGAASNTVERQKVDALYNIDCYACAVSKDDGFNAGGHLSGDQVALERAQDAARIVRQILMSGPYTYLGMQGVVWKRWLQSLTVFQPQIDNRQAQRIAAARLAFQVQFSEFSPQNQGVVLESVQVEVKRAETGQVYLLAEYPST